MCLLVAYQDVTSALQSLFPAVANSDFVPDTANIVNMDTGTDNDWDLNYIAVSQTLGKAIISVSIDKENFRSGAARPIYEIL
jgi:hypothetical protein